VKGWQGEASRKIDLTRRREEHEEEGIKLS
jgi:hypothetical protein